MMPLVEVSSTRMNLSHKYPVLLPKLLIPVQRPHVMIKLVKKLWATSVQNLTTMVKLLVLHPPLRRLPYSILKFHLFFLY